MSIQFEDIIPKVDFHILQFLVSYCQYQVLSCFDPECRIKKLATTFPPLSKAISKTLFVVDGTFQGSKAFGQKPLGRQAFGRQSQKENR